MARIDINGIGIAYEIIGDGPKTAAITPGGRFSKDTPGVRQLAEALAPHGFKTLIWDRPNCGESDACFEGESESLLDADTLAALLKQLDFPPSLLVGGSGGARQTLLCGLRHPEVCSGLFLLWVTAGAIGLASLVMAYNYSEMEAAITKGMEAVTKLPGWQEPITRNPRNRDIILAQNPERFIETMQRWAASFFPTTDAPVPGITAADLAGIKVPVVVLRSGTTDMFHIRAGSEALASQIPGAMLQEPPWGNDEWIERMAEPQNGLFKSWPKLAPQIVALSQKIW